MDVATLVKSITSAFEDASTLVNRIRKKKEDDSNAQLAPIDDLLDSLTLGPTVVRGFYESDARRFGNAYTTGDAIAQGQLKDALINLQMTVLAGLRAVILDEKDPDYDAIQAASDDCRVNVGVCLGQLSHRVSQAARGMPSPGRMHIYDNIQRRPVDRSGSQSTQSSGQTRLPPMTPPESDTEYLGDHGTITSPPRHIYGARAPDLDAMSGMHAASYNGLYSNLHDNSVTVPLMYQRSSSVPMQHQRPVSPAMGSEGSGPEGHNQTRFHPRASSVSTNLNAYTPPRGSQSSFYQPYQNQDGYFVGGMPGDANSWGYFMSQQQQQLQAQYQQQHENSRPTSYNELNAATLGKSPTQRPATINRKPPSTSHSGAIVTSPTSAPINSSIPEECEKEVYYGAPMPVRSVSRSGQHPRPGSFVEPDSMSRQDSLWPQYSPQNINSQQGEPSPSLNEFVSPVNTLQHDDIAQYTGIVSPPGTLQQNEIQQITSAMRQMNTLPRQDSVPYSVSSLDTRASSNIRRQPSVARANSVPLSLPSEKDTLGYCKGAFRLQIGLEKKAFGVANRPYGYSGMLQYWKCEKCYFEGPCTTIVPPDGKKPLKVFDATIRDASGIRFRWAFLAKCHVPLKTMPEGKRDGLYGSFACIFCTAEAAQRGWNINVMSMSNAKFGGDNASIKSAGSGSNNGSTNASTTNSATVFGNVTSLLEHLQVHRQQEYWPCIEMQGRMKCIVGKVAHRSEEFDINLLPIIPVSHEQN